MSERTHVEAACRCGFELASGLNWRSYDPFDLLLVRSGEALRKSSSIAARALVQLGTRSGARTRRMMHIAPHEEPKALADFLLASVVLASRSGACWARSYTAPLCARLERSAIRTPHGVGWGLSFPYASRFVSAAAHTPNAYTTVSSITALAHAAHAAEERSSDSLLALAIAGTRMIRDDLGVVHCSMGNGFRYWLGENVCIINVQALIAGCFQELGQAVNDPQLLTAAAGAAKAAVAAQRRNGSFPYATDHRGQFIDAFHTGFVLEGLARFRAAGGSLGASTLDDCIAKGLTYLRKYLIGPSGLPRRRPGGPESCDGQNIGQLVQTLCVAGDQADLRTAAKIWNSHVPQRLPGPDSTALADPQISLRWELGPLVLAGAYLAQALTEGS